MMQKLQRFGGAMFVPVLLFSFSGIVVALGIKTIAITIPNLAESIVAPVVGETNLF